MTRRRTGPSITARAAAALVALAVLAAGCAARGSGAARSATSAGATSTSEPATATSAAGARTTARPRTATTTTRSRPRSAAIDPVWTALTAPLGDDAEPDVDLSRRIFAAVFGPLPGVDATPIRGDIPVDGTTVVRWLVGHWDEMTPDQRTAAQALLGPPADAVTTPGKSRALKAPAPERVQQYESWAADAFTYLGEHWGPFPGTYEVVVDGSAYQPNAKVLANTTGLDAKGGYKGQLASCRIRVFSASDASDGPSTMVHEAAHCYQAAFAGLDAFYSSARFPSWLMEGSATWAELVIVPDPSLASRWAFYFDTPGRPLTRVGSLTNAKLQGYNDIGFFGKVGDEGVDLWKALPDAFRAGGSTAAFQRLTDPVAKAFLQDWGASYLRKGERGAAWDISGPDIPDATETPTSPASLTVGDSGSQSVDTPRMSARAATVTSGADLVEVASGGYARLGDDQSHAATLAGGTVLLCLRDGGDCACPPGSTGEIPAHQTMSSPFDVGFSGGTEAVQLTVTGHKLDDYCHPKDKSSGFCDALRAFHAFDLKAVAAGGATYADPALLKAQLDQRVRLIQAMIDTAPDQLSAAVTTFGAMWREISGAYAAAGYVVASEAGKKAGSAQIAAYKKYGYPAVLAPVIAYGRTACSVDLNATS